MQNLKFDFDDVLIQPSQTTHVISRKDVSPFDKYENLPLITAPMDTVINGDNQHVFVDNKIIPCQPRGIEAGPDGFTSYSLSQFQKKFLSNKVPITSKVLIDTANGHISTLIDVVKRAKEIYGSDMTLMVGNIANPYTYCDLSKAGADLIRCGVGNGGGCLTTQQLGIGYPMGSLISECYKLSCTLDNPAKIVADGGMKKYADIIKALALGADYVMIGSIFNKALESATPCLIDKVSHLSEQDFNTIEMDDAVKMLAKGVPIYKMFRGMSTKEVQKDWGAKDLKTSEGVVKHQKVEYTVEGWVDNFESYLRSAMSYTNSFTLSEFIGNVEINLITQNAFNRFNK
jgi:GMP reductase